MAVNQELKSIIKTIKFKEGVTQDIIAAKLGVQPTYLSDAINGRVVFSDALRERIYEQYSYIKSEGEMLNKIESQSIVAESANNYTSNTDVIEVEAEEIANFSLPFANNDIAQSRDIDIRELVESNSPKLDRYYVGRKLVGRDKYAQRIITEAMTGANFIPGDVLILSYLNDGSEMHSGYAYLFDTKKYGTLFRQVFIKDGHYELKPCNPNFETLCLKDEDIRSFARLVMQIRTSFSFEQGAMLTEFVQQRDRHIRKLADSIKDSITAHSQVLDNQAELIAELRKQNDRVDKERERTERERERTDKLIEKIINQ